jgi:hypothetical protein
MIAQHKNTLPYLFFEASNAFQSLFTCVMGNLQTIAKLSVVCLQLSHDALVNS